MLTLGNDLLYACRLWRRAPVFAVVVVCTIALAVGAATAVFSVVHGLFGPLPFPESGRLVKLYSLDGNGGAPMSFTPEDFVRWRSRARSLARIASRRSGALSFAVPGREPERVTGWGVTAGYFDLLGCPPLAGRLLRDADFAPGAPPVAVISQRLWWSRLGGDPHAVGRTVLLDGQAVAVVGILNDRVEENLGDVWRPYVADPQGPLHDSSYLEAFGRLAPGVSLAQAQRAMAVPAGERRHTLFAHALGVEVVPLREQMLRMIHRGHLATLLTAAGCLFLVACANLVSLSFAWISWRRREIALRVALGAAPRRIVRQLLAEVLVLAATGGLLGILFAAAGLRVILGLNPGAIPPIPGLLADGISLLFALGVSLLAGMAVGLWPALDAARTELRALLGTPDAGRRERAPVRWMGGALIAVEVAAAFVLLSSAGLSLRGFFRLAATDPGFQTEQRLSARVALPEQRYDENGQSAFYTSLAERLRAIPGFAAAGVLSSVPMTSDRLALEFLVPGKVPGAPLRQVCMYRLVTPGTLKALGIPLTAGRDLATADGPGAPWVAVVNESLARRVWPGQPAVGRTIGLSKGNNAIGRTTIVGVMADFRNRLDEEPVPEMYLPFAQWGSPEASVVVLTTVDAPATDRILRAVVHTLDPDVPVDPAVPFGRIVSESLSPFRFGAVLLALYAALALILAAVGVYGVISYSVARRRSEIALRLALGARRGAILWMVCRQTLLPTFAGLAAGAVAALAAGRLLAGQLFGVSAGDPAVFLTVLAVLLGVSLCATAEPALRIAATDPADAMR